MSKLCTRSTRFLAPVWTSWQNYKPSVWKCTQKGYCTNLPLKYYDLANLRHPCWNRNTPLLCDRMSLSLITIATLSPITQTPHCTRFTNVYNLAISGHKSQDFFIRNHFAHLWFKPDLTLPDETEVLTYLYNQHIQSLQSNLSCSQGATSVCECCVVISCKQDTLDHEDCAII